jgi:hypothetical protein
MSGIIALGTAGGMAAYVAMGGENYAAALVVCLFSSIAGIVIAEKIYGA